MSAIDEWERRQSMKVAQMFAEYEDAVYCDAIGPRLRFDDYLERYAANDPAMAQYVAALLAADSPPPNE